jgi:hypothetical protein
MNARYQVRCSESGDIIEDCETLEQAELVIDEYERQDRTEGIYSHGFYEIYDIENETTALYYT